MPSVARITDDTSHAGGFIITGSVDTLVNGLSMAHVGSLLNPHSVGMDNHPAEVIVTGSLKTFVNGFAVARVSDLCSLGAIVIEGSPTVLEGI